MPSKALVILTFNEIKGSQHIYKNIPFELFDEILVIDGGSTDGTIDFWAEKGHKVVVQGKKGRGSAFVLANHLLQSQIMIFFSPDGNEDPQDIPKILDAFNSEADLVVATRFGHGGSSDDAGLVRSFGNKMFTLLIRVFFRIKTTDAVNGFRGIRKAKFEELRLPNSKFEIEFQMTVRAGKLKYKLVEIPTHERDRIGGFSKAGTFAVGFAYVKLFLKELFTGKRFLRKSFDNDVGEYKTISNAVGAKSENR